MRRTSPLLPVLSIVIATACADATGASPRRTTAAEDSVTPTLSEQVNSLAAAAWCGSSAPLTGGVLPAGWSSANAGSPGSGLLYHRANAQGGGWVTISIPGAVTAPITEIRLNYVAYNDATFTPGASGMARAITMFTNAGIYQVLEGNDRYNAGELFFRSEQVSVPYPNPSSSVVYKVVSKPGSYGVYRVSVRIRNGVASVQSTDVLTGAIITSTQLPLTGFTLSSVQGLQIGAGSSDNPVWFDGMTIACI